MDILKNKYFILAFRNLFLYFDIENHLKDTDESDKDIIIDETEAHIITVKEKKKIICLQEIGAGQSCVVIEDLDTREVSFFTFKMVSDVTQQLSDDS